MPEASGPPGLPEASRHSSRQCTTHHWLLEGPRSPRSLRPETPQATADDQLAGGPTTPETLGAALGEPPGRGVSGGHGGKWRALTSNGGQTLAQCGVMCAKAANKTRGRGMPLLVQVVPPAENLLSTTPPRIPRLRTVHHLPWDWIALLQDSEASNPTNTHELITKQRGAATAT